MASHAIIITLRTLIELYTHLLQVSKQKTEAIKAYQLEPLEKLLVTERKLIQQIEKAESKRYQVVKAWFDSNESPGTERTITVMLAKLADDSIKKELERLSTQLRDLLTELKKQEALNQQLLEQSLQFVHLSLNMMNPSMEQINYGRNDTSPLPKRSVFDSKA